VLIGSEGDEADFKKVYPFSPALVEALVALSDCLQRERTAIRILMELLVNHLPDLELGRVVPVGDAFDALAEAEDPIDDPVMRRASTAPDLTARASCRSSGGSTTRTTAAASACGGPRPSPRLQRLPEKMCRNDNRLAKTLLMAALVPAKPFKALTVKRSPLNSTIVPIPVPDAVVAQRLRDWASQVSALRPASRPIEVNGHLAGVDLQPTSRRPLGRYGRRAQNACAASCFRPRLDSEGASSRPSCPSGTRRRVRPLRQRSRDGRHHAGVPA
jgi:hypothetical protein